MRLGKLQMCKLKISPIFYMGAKRRLIRKGLIDLFPKHITRYYEPFAGSAIVAMNVKTNEYYLNDINYPLYQLWWVFRQYSSDAIVKHINKRIEEFGLPRERTRRCDFKDIEKLSEYKTAYDAFRKEYNRTKNPLDLFTLMFYSFSQQMRFNAQGEFNMPFGDDCFGENNIQYIKDGCRFFTGNNIHLSNWSFDFFFDEKTFWLPTNIKDQFVYFDPPYLNTTATYNEHWGDSLYTWSAEWEQKLRDRCEKLDNNDIPFALSNVFANKSFVNTDLMNWCEENNFRVHHFGNHTYTACGKGNSQTDEVLIMNY